MERGKYQDSYKLPLRPTPTHHSQHSHVQSGMFSKNKQPAKRHHDEQEQLPDREREIRMAIEMRFGKSRMNKEYVYEGDFSSRSGRESTHSSDMPEYEHLKNLRFVNLHEQNKKKKQDKPDKNKPLRTSGMGRFKIANNNSGNYQTIRRTEGDERENSRVSSNDRSTVTNQSPLGLLSKYLFKSGKTNKKQEKRRVNLSEESSKYKTLAVPQIENSKELIRYNHKLVKSKQQLSRDSSLGQNSNILKSNLTLQVEFKKKYNRQNVSNSYQYRNISSSTRIGSNSANKMLEKGQRKVISTSSGKLNKNNDKLLKLLLTRKL